MPLALNFGVLRQAPKPIHVNWAWATHPKRPWPTAHHWLRQKVLRGAKNRLFFGRPAGAGESFVVIEKNSPEPTKDFAFPRPPGGPPPRGGGPRRLPTYLDNWAHGVVVSHPLSMWEALGSIPSVSILRNTPRPRQPRPPPPNLQPTPTNSNAGYSSVGAASDCRRLQQSDGPWFDSGWPDICTAHTSPDTNQAKGCTKKAHTRI